MRAILAAALILAPGAAAAEVVSAGPHGFHIRHSVQLVVPQPDAFAAFGNIGSWWSGDHTYSGDAANLSLQLRPGGCFCERLPDGGGIEHLRVAYVAPGERVVLTGSLGPLLFEATNGVLDVQVERIAGGSRLTMDYKVAGFAEGGAEKLAPIVDQVLGEQMKRYRESAVPQVKR